MVCLFLLPVVSKITTDCLILIGSWKMSLNLIGFLKSYHVEQNSAHHNMTREVLGYMLVPRKSLYPFFWLNLSPDKVWHKNSCILLIKVVLVAYLLTASLLLLPSLLASDFEADAAADELLALAARCLSRSQSILLIGYSFSLPPASELDRPLGVWLCDCGGWDAVA